MGKSYEAGTDDCGIRRTLDRRADGLDETRFGQPGAGYDARKLHADVGAAEH